MSLKANDDLVLWGLALIQPSSAVDIHNLLKVLYPDSGPLPIVQNIQLSIERLVKHGHVVVVNVKANLYSITEHGHERIPKNQRYLRDRIRLFLLKKAQGASFIVSEGVAQELSGDSPDSDVSSGIKEVARPVDSAVIPHGRKGSLARTYGRVYWPRLLEQLNSPVGLIAASSDIPLSYFSFHTVAAINSASKREGFEKDINFVGLALAIGISPRLLGYLSREPQRNYRRFEIGKRGGGTRVIHSPRVFLKTIQCWIKDYILWRLPTHSNCHSYIRGRSIVTNARAHVGKSYVANIDIEDFFGSLSAQHVKSALVTNGIGEHLAYAISRLATLNDFLPQGAPTSPALSNCCLFNFDERMTNACQELELQYSRYADDITISGENKGSIQSAIEFAEVSLQRIGLRLNKKKTRIASLGGQQRVAGVVVNKYAQPPRVLRRKVRAMFHNAMHNADEQIENLSVLSGYASYLNSFPHLRDSSELQKYREFIKRISRE